MPASLKTAEPVVEASARNSAADIEADAKTLDATGDAEKLPPRKGKPGEAWKQDEVHKIPHK
jgi:hypothetical protein